MSEERVTWDDVEDAELLRAILELLEAGEISPPACRRCLRLLREPDSENSPRGDGYEQVTW